MFSSIFQTKLKRLTFPVILQRKADTSQPDEGTEAIQQWLGPIRALAVANLRTSENNAPEKDPVKELSHLVEQNVCAQVSNVSNSSVLQKAWRDGKKVTVHGEPAICLINLLLV